MSETNESLCYEYVVRDRKTFISFYIYKPDENTHYLVGTCPYGWSDHAYGKNLVIKTTSMIAFKDAQDRLMRGPRFGGANKPNKYTPLYPLHPHADRPEGDEIAFAWNRFEPTLRTNPRAIQKFQMFAQ